MNAVVVGKGRGVIWCAVSSAEPLHYLHSRKCAQECIPWGEAKSNLVYRGAMRALRALTRGPGQRLLHPLHDPALTFCGNLYYDC